MTPHPAPRPDPPSLAPLCREISQGTANVTFHGKARTKEVDEKSSLPGLRIIAPDRLPAHPYFGYIWLRLGSSFFRAPEDISFLGFGEGFTSAAFELDDQPRWAECFNPISTLFVSSFSIFSVLFFFFFYTSYMCLRSSPNPEDFNSKKCF